MTIQTIRRTAALGVFAALMLAFGSPRDAAAHAVEDPALTKHAPEPTTFDVRRAANSPQEPIVVSWKSSLARALVRGHPKRKPRRTTPTTPPPARSAVTISPYNPVMMVPYAAARAAARDDHDLDAPRRSSPRLRRAPGARP